MIPTDEIYYADNEGVRLVSTDKDFVETHRLRCTYCGQKFFTQIPVASIYCEMVECPSCGRFVHEIIDASKPDFLTKTLNIPTTRNTSSDLYDSLLYAAELINKNNMEDKNMKKAEKNIEKDQNITITRRCDTARGVFTVEQLEPTDLFVCVGDEKQTIYMAVTDPNNEQKYKTKKPVVNIETGEIWYFDNSTKVYVYRAGCELRVGEFIWSSEGYN